MEAIAAPYLSDPANAAALEDEKLRDATSVDRHEQSKAAKELVRLMDATP